MTTKIQLKALDALAEKLAQTKARGAELGKLMRAERKMLATIEAMDCAVSADVNYGSVDIQIIGDGAALTRVWRVLRLNGYAPDEHPKEAMPYFSTFWKKGDRKLYMSFSSTVCERKQVGTRTEQVPVYETVCNGGGELLTD